MSDIQELIRTAVKAGDDRLEGRISRDEHGRILAGIEPQILAMGLTWEKFIELAR